MKLRAHHLLCLLNFVGEGYSDAFTANMAACRRELEAEDVFALCEGTDEICAACPHRRGARCDAEEKVLRYDAALSRLLGLRAGERYAASALRERIRTEVFAARRLREICGDCEWYGLCAGLIEEEKEGKAC